MSKKPNEKKKKEKVVYIDDGRTIADMSNLPNAKMPNYNTGISTFKDKWITYWSAVKMMVVPMLIMVGILCVAFGLAWLAFTFL